MDERPVMTDKPSIRVPSREWGPHYSILWEVACSPTFGILAYRWEKGFRGARREVLRRTWNVKQQPYTKHGDLRAQFRGDKGYALQWLLIDLEQRFRGNPVFADPRAYEYREAMLDLFERIWNRRESRGFPGPTP